MATLTALKLALEQTTTETASSIRQQLSEAQYSIDFDIAVHGSGRVTYQDFIIPQLSDLINPLCTSRSRLSVLEIAPGPKSAFGHLPYHLRRKIRRYVAIEPNQLFADRLEQWLRMPAALSGRPACYPSVPVHSEQQVSGSQRGKIRCHIVSPQYERHKDKPQSH